MKNNICKLIQFFIAQSKLFRINNFLMISIQEINLYCNKYLENMQKSCDRIGSFCNLSGLQKM
jgi:hypothetical protein